MTNISSSATKKLHRRITEHEQLLNNGSLFDYLIRRLDISELLANIGDFTR